MKRAVQRAIALSNPRRVNIREEKAERERIRERQLADLTRPISAFSRLRLRIAR
jgi:hypothetical protein